MARGIKFGFLQTGRIGRRPTSGRAFKSTSSTLPGPSTGRTALGIGGRGRGLTSAQDVESANNARFTRPSRRSNA
jgi:hypothetical protein